MMINEEAPCIFSGQKLNKKNRFSPASPQFPARSEGPGIDSLFMCKAEYKEESSTSFPLTDKNNQEDDDDDKSLSSEDNNRTDKTVTNNEDKKLNSTFYIKSEVTSHDDGSSSGCRKRSSDSIAIPHNQLPKR